MNTLLIVLPILTVLMFDLGLTLKPGDFSLVMKHPKPVIIALFGQIVLLPLLAYGISVAFHLPPVFLIGMVLIACCPGGSSSNLFSRLAGGNVALSVILTALSSIITLFTVPLIMAFTTAHAGEAVGITLPVGNLLKQNVVLMLVPVLLGIALHAAKPNIADALDRVLSKTVFPALLILMSVFFIQHHKTIISYIGSLGLCVCLLILAASSLAALLSRIFRIEGPARRTVVIEVGMQNAAQAIAVASSPFIFNNNEMAIPAILYSLLMNLVLLGYVALAKRELSKEKTD